MRLKRVTIKNWMGLPDLEFKPKALTIISGKNGRGKTSVLEVLRAFDERIHDPARIRAGSELAEATIEMDNGHVYRMRVTPKSTTWDFTDEKGRKITKSSEHIHAIINSISMDPVKFSEASGKPQVEMFLKACPMTLTAQDLAFVPVEALKGVDLDKHALEVIGDERRGLYGTFYQARADANRIAKEKRATVKQLSEGLPEDAPEGENWAKIWENTSNEYRALQTSTSARIKGIEDDAVTADQGQKELLATQRDLLKSGLESKIDQLRRDFEQAAQRLRDNTAGEIGNLENRCNQELTSIQDHRDEALKAVDAEHQPKIRDLNERLAQARAMTEQHAKTQTTRDFIAGEETKIKAADAESKRADETMKQLDALKTKLSAESPIPGIEVTPDELMLNGVPLRITNEAEKLRIALEVSKLTPSECGLIVIDNAEHLDSENWDGFKIMAKEAAGKAGLQFFAARVTDEPFSIRTEEGVA